MARIVVVGGSGHIGAKVAAALKSQVREVVAASRKLGVNTVTGHGLADAVVDASNCPSFEAKPAIEFFATSTMNLLAAERAAAVGHHVALSVMATDRLRDSGYFRAKLAQEELIKASGVPYSIVRAAPVYDFLEIIADAATDNGAVRLPDVLIQPAEAADIAKVVAAVALGKPLNDTIEVAGPNKFALDELVREISDAQHNPRHIVADAHARYFGTLIDKHTLLPSEGAVITSTTLNDWMAQRHWG